MHQIGVGWHRPTGLIHHALNKIRNVTDILHILLNYVADIAGRTLVIFIGQRQNVVAQLLGALRQFADRVRERLNIIE